MLNKQIQLPVCMEAYIPRAATPGTFSFRPILLQRLFMGMMKQKAA